MSGKVQQAVNQKVFASAISQGRDWKEALRSVTAQVKEQLHGKTCDMAMVFVSEPYPDIDHNQLAQLFLAAMPSRLLIGCNASGVIGDRKEVENEPGISVLAIHAPEVQILPFAFSQQDIESLKGGADLIQEWDIYPTDRPHFLCFGDPMNGDVQKFLDAINEGYEGRPVIGGLASGGAMGLPNWLFLDGHAYPEGVVGAVLTGPIEFESVVSQGCRPIGKRFAVTKADQHVLYELAGKPALDVLKEVLMEASSHDRSLAQQALFTGLVMNEQQSSFKRGDFLIRNLMGVDPASRSLMVGASLRIGQTLQFHVRDADTSAEDLSLSLQRLGESSSQAQGAIIVSCCGRGEGLYGRPNHDIELIQSLRGPLPVTGFFANGEIGPVGHRNYIHGYTASLVLIK